MYFVIHFIHSLIYFYLFIYLFIFWGVGVGVGVRLAKFIIHSQIKPAPIVKNNYQSLYGNCDMVALYCSIDTRIQ